MNELEEMRSQLTILKEKLEKETIVSDKLLREVTRKNVRHLNRAVWIEGIGAAFVLTIGNCAFRFIGCSWWFIAGTTLLMIFSFLATFIPHHWVKQSEIMSGDLLQVAKQVRRLRKWYKDWLKIDIALGLGWIAWCVWEFYQNLIDKTIFDVNIVRTMCIGLVVGGLIGGLIGLFLHKTYTHEMDNIIRQIEEV